MDVLIALEENLKEINKEASVVKTEPNLMLVKLGEDEVVRFSVDELTKERIEIIKSKVIYFTHSAMRIHARKCVVKKVDKPTASLFLSSNHWKGSALAKVNVGCFYQRSLVCLCSFATPRKFSEHYTSGELIRFANKNNFVVVGGLDKLLKWYIKNYPVQDIMTYVDKQWGNGSAFEKLGFKQVDSNQQRSFKYVLYIDNLTEK